MRRNFVIITPLLSILVIWGLNGCENAVNTSTICKNNPELCDDLHRDSWCLAEKNDVIMQRYGLKTTPSPSGKQIYDLLLNLEDYNRCIGLSANVEHILHPQRTNDRTRAFGMSAQSLAELRESTKESDDTYLAFYRWIRLGDKQAQKIVIEAYQSGSIDDPIILAQLAAYYQKFDLDKAKQMYLSLLDTATPEEFDANWLLGLASIYQQQSDLEKAYIYSKANVLMSDNTASPDKMSALTHGDKKLEIFLTKQAENLVKHLNNGDYAASEIRHQLQPGS